MKLLSDAFSSKLDVHSEGRSSSLWLAIAFVLLAAFARILPHPVNFTPLGAMALFGAAAFSSRAIAVILPLAAYWLSDLFLNQVVYSAYYDGFVWFTSGFGWMYGAMVLTSVIGFAILRSVSVGRIIGASLITSTAFFLITNFGVWAGSTLYPQTLAGLTACYVAAIPFFQNALAGDLFFSAALFSAYAYVRHRDLERTGKVHAES
jgi:hypothetical protein